MRDLGEGIEIRRLYSKFGGAGNLFVKLKVCKKSDGQIFKCISTFFLEGQMCKNSDGQICKSSEGKI